MSCVLSRRLLAGLLLSTAALVAAPALAQATLVAAPPTKAQAGAGQFAQLCEAKLKLAPAQTAALHTYLDQETTYLAVLDANGLTEDTPDLTTTESTQLDQVVAKMLAPGQQRDYQKLRQMPQAQTYLRDMALLPDGPENLAKSKERKNRTSQMMAQRADGAE
jgi:DMSO/TMAO reductase YedYZ molybdopterin-dependent catalytic subunit